MPSVAGAGVVCWAGLPALDAACCSCAGILRGLSRTRKARYCGLFLELMALGSPRQFASRLFVRPNRVMDIAAGGCIMEISRRATSIASSRPTRGPTPASAPCQSGNGRLVFVEEASCCALSGVEQLAMGRKWT